MSISKKIDTSVEDKLNKKVAQLIAKEYDSNREAKMQRLAFTALADGKPLPSDVVKYNKYVNQCIKDVKG